MEIKRYKPKIDKLFVIIWLPLSILLIITTIFSFIEILAFFLMLFVDVFTFYFMISSLVGYVELRENTMYIKFGFILKKEIPYNKIIDIFKEKSFMSTSMLSLKNSFEHIIIKFNKYDTVVVSVLNNEELINNLKEKMN